MLHSGTNSNPIPLPQGQYTSNSAEEKIPDIGHMHAKRTAPTGGKSAQEKRYRSTNWADEEKTYLLVAKRNYIDRCILQSLSRSTSTFQHGKRWFHNVSGDLGRAAKSCQGQWDSLLKFYNAIFDHESKVNSGTIRHVSFWKLNDHEKRIVNEERHIAKLEQLPRVFPRFWYELMESIISAKEYLCSRKVDGNSPSSSTVPVASAITDSDGAIRSHPSSSHDRSSMNPPLPLLSNQGAEDEFMAMPDEVLFPMIDSYVTKQVEDVVKTQVIPLLRGQDENEPKYHQEKLSLLRSQKEDEQKHREKLLVIEAEKLALKRDKLGVKCDKLAVERDKLAVMRDKLAVKREKINLMTSPRGASSMTHVAATSPEAGVAAAFPEAWGGFGLSGSWGGLEC